MWDVTRNKTEFHVQTHLPWFATPVPTSIVIRCLHFKKCTDLVTINVIYLNFFFYGPKLVPGSSYTVFVVHCQNSAQMIMSHLLPLPPPPSTPTPPYLNLCFPILRKTEDFWGVFVVVVLFLKLVIVYKVPSPSPPFLLWHQECWVVVKSWASFAVNC